MSETPKDITQYFNYASMTHFMKEIGEPNLVGVFTVRLTPTKNILTEPEIETWIKTLEENNAVKKILAFKEKTPKTHYHIRLVTQYKTRKSIADLIKNTWTWEATTGLSNKIYSVHDCKSKDKTLWKSATYIAKEGDCVSHYGYMPCHVSTFVNYSKRLRKFKDTPKYKRIIYLYNLDHDSMPNTGRIYDAIIDYHKTKKLEIPERYRINNLMHNICFNLSENYRQSMKESMLEQFDMRINGQW